LVCAVALAGWAFVQRQDAVRAEQSAQNDRQAAESQQKLATARQLVAQADSIANADPRTAVRLSLAAQHLHPDDAPTTDDLLNHVIGSHLTASLDDFTGPVHSVVFSPDGRTLATSNEGTILLWKVIDPAHPTQIGQPLEGHPDSVLTMAFSPDGRTLATGGNGGTVILWDVGAPAQPRRIGQPIRGQSKAV